ncbi:MAG: hypothetical protein CBC82_01855 [Cellvibrionales bacterium TMED122]|nr:hypothetical protein [Halieaceae bacterium]OUV66849.1 MAG: hypothetical protein CBC82_01855 [Cellvibrionales bacterium TMED122]
MHKRFSLILGFALSLSVPLEGWSLGLGAISLSSHLNEPLRAEIVLLEAGELAVRDLQIGLASSEEFSRVGVRRDPYLSEIEFAIESDGLDKRVLLRSEAPLREPYLQLVVEARWPEGRMLKEYTVLIDLPPRPVGGNPAANTQRGLAAEAASLVSMEADAGIDDDIERYVDGTSDRPAAGGQYLVSTTDTLWRIASEAAVDGVSIEQTMLEIVAANPAAFQDRNVNGLKAGYVLQLPDEADIRIGLASALDKVAEQHDEWALASGLAASGLTLVADENSTFDAQRVQTDIDPEPAEESEAAHLAENTLAPPSSSAAELSELASLVTTVGQLQASIEALQARLAEQDAELTRLRARLATQAANETTDGAGVASEETALSGTFGSPVWLWPLSLGATVLLVAGAMAIWGRRARHSTSSGEADDIADTAVIPEPRTKTAALATSFIEEAEVYIAYGRLDQAIEVLNDAVSEGLASETVTLRLIDCYVDSGRIDEAWALPDQLARSLPPELLEQVRQRLVDAGASSVTAAGSKSELEQAHAQRSEVELSEENTSAKVAVSGATSGLSLASIDAETGDEPAAGEEHAAIYGSETDPMDSQLDLARAYIDMGDEEGARPVLTSVIKEGDLSQQAQARELLLRIEVT